MKLPAAEVCPRPDTDRALHSAAPPLFPPPLRAIPWEVAGAVLPMRTGEGGRIHTRGFRASHSIWNPARTRHCPVVPFQSILCSFVNLPGQPLPQHPAPSLTLLSGQKVVSKMRYTQGGLSSPLHRWEGGEMRSCPRAPRDRESEAEHTSQAHAPSPTTPCSESSGLHGARGGRGPSQGALTGHGDYCWGCRRIISQTWGLALRPLWLRKQLMRL